MDAVILDSELVPLMEGAPSFSFTAELLPSIREAGLGVPVELSDDVERTDHVVSTDPHVVVRVHRPKGVDGPLPCIYSIHGGGYILGTYAMDDARFDRYCTLFPCVGVSVEYRLAPETPYPGPLEDCYAGLKWTYEHRDELGIDAERLGIAGVSAGGGLAAALALLARDRAEVPLSFQLLECPMVCDRQVTSSSQLDGLPIWSRDSNEFGWRSYLGDLYGTDDIPIYAAPARDRPVGTADRARHRRGRRRLPRRGHRLRDATQPVWRADRVARASRRAHGVQMFQGSGIARRWDHLVTSWLELQLQK